MLEFNASVFEAIEQGHLSWNNWDGIHAFHEKYLDGVRLQVKAKVMAKATDSSENKDSTFVSTDYMRGNGICFKFQNSACDQEGSHILDSTKSIVHHICGLCHLKNKENQADHGYKTCSLKTKVF